MPLLLVCLAVSSVTLAQAPARCVQPELDNRLAKLEEHFVAYQALRFGRTSPGLLRDVKEAVRQQQELSREYTRIASLRCGRASVDALVMVGRTLEELATKFSEAPAPAGLDAEQVALYRSELEARALPISERAQSTYADAVRQADELGLTDELIQLARSRTQATRAR